MKENDFAARLALVMSLTGASQSDIARSLGISQATVSRWASGSLPRFALASKLASFLKCGTEWLIEGKGDDMGSLIAFHKARESAKENVPVRLRQLRDQTGFGVNAFARKVGYAPSYISRLEKGSRANPSAKFLDRLTQCFGVNRRWILYGEKPIVSIPPESLPSVIPVVDVSLLEKLERMDRSEHGASVDELTRVLDAVSKELKPKQMASLIDGLNQRNWGGEFTESVSAVLKDLLVKKLSGRGPFGSTK